MRLIKNCSKNNNNNHLTLKQFQLRKSVLIVLAIFYNSLEE